MQLKSIFLKISTVTCALLLLFAGIAKVSAFSDLLTFLAGVHFLHPAATVAIALLLPAVEITLGMALLLSSPDSRQYLLFAAILFAGFTLFQVLQAIPATALASTGCPCFGRLFQDMGSFGLVCRSAIPAVLAFGATILTKPST